MITPAKISEALALSLSIRRTSGPSQAVPSSSSIEMLDAEDFLDLHDRAGVDEQAGKRLGLLEQAAAVAAEVHHHGVDAVLS